MSVEDIYGDLEKIAKHVGSLDKDAVRDATSILARPRYTASVDPPGLLVDDLKSVIEAIPNYPVPATSANVEWSSYKFQNYARRYFSLDAAGQMFTNRRNFGRKDPGGSVGAWMNRGVLYRVAAGLLALWAPDNDPRSNIGYRIDRVRATRDLYPGLLFDSKSDSLRYDLRLVVSGPHLLPLPLPARFTSLSTVVTECDDGTPKAQLVALGGKRLAGLGGSKRVAAVVFGSQQPSGERVAITVERHTFEDGSPTHPGGRPTGSARSMYRVDQPVSRLELAVDLQSSKDYKWQVFKTAHDELSGPPIDIPAVGSWYCDSPEVGYTYLLLGSRLTKAERRQRRLESTNKR